MLALTMQAKVTCDNHAKYAHTLAHRVSVIVPAYPLASTLVLLPDIAVVVHDVPDEVQGNELDESVEECLHGQSVRSLVVLNTSRWNICNYLQVLHLQEAYIRQSVDISLQSVGLLYKQHAQDKTESGILLTVERRPYWGQC